MSTVRFLRRFSAFESARADFLTTLEAEGRAAATVAKYRYAIDRLARFAGAIDPATITAGHLRGWATQLRAEGLATSTQHDYLVWVKSWLKWLADEGGYGVQASATARARPARVVQEPIVPFTEAEIRRLFAACPARTMRGQRSRAIIATLLDTGIRAGEARGLRLGDADLDEGQLVVLPTTDKTRKGRTIALGRRARLELGRYWTRYRVGTGLDDAPTAPLFIAETGRALERRALQLLLRLGKRADVGNVHPHRFRHTFAILSLQAGMDPFVLMHTLGHKDMTMTKRYLNLVHADVREAKRASSPLDRVKF